MCIGGEREGEGGQRTRQALGGAVPAAGGVMCDDLLPGSDGICGSELRLMLVTELPAKLLQLPRLQRLPELLPMPPYPCMPSLTGRGGGICIGTNCCGSCGVNGG